MQNTPESTQNLLKAIGGFNIDPFDYIDFGYTSGNLTSLTFKAGGASGRTVAAITLTYDADGNLDTMSSS